MNERIRNIKQLLDVSPKIPEYGGGKWAIYAISCCWWTSFPDDLATNAVDLPCCPHCGSLLMQAPLKKFVEFAQENPGHYGKYGIDAFLEAHSRNATTCHDNWNKYNDDIERRFHPSEPPTFA